MPGNLVQFLRLTPSGVRTVTLADGEDQDVNSYVTSVSWLGRLREVAVYQLETDPLIGTSLLVGCRVSLEVAEGGAVLIDELTGQ